MSSPVENADAGPTRAGNTLAGDVWANCKRWATTAVRNRFVLAGTLIQPVVFLVLFTQVFGGVATEAINRGGGSVSYVTYLAPAIAMQVSLAAAGTSGVGLVYDMENGIFQKVLASPMRRSAVFAGKTIAELALIAVQISIVLVLSVALGATVETGLPGALGVVAIGMLSAIWFLAISNVVAVVTRDQESTFVATNLLQFPLLFLSSAFLPLASLPGWVQTVATLNPVTYSVDAARALVVGRDVLTAVELSTFGGVWDTLVPAVGVLAGLAVLFGALAVAMLRRATSATVQ